MDKLKITVGCNGKAFERASAAGENVHAFLRREGFYIPAVCGGGGICGKCLVLVKSGSLSVAGAEVAAGETALACGSSFTGDAAIEILAKERDFCVSGSLLGAETAGEFSGDIGIAVDIGTTTLVICAADMSSGNIVGIYRALNRQREYGADVISRIEKSKTHLSEMRESVREDILKGILFIIADKKIPPETVKKIALVGNPAMISIFLNEDCSSLGVFPFTLSERVLKGTELTFFEAFGTAAASCPVQTLPCFSSFVGADSLAAFIFTDILNQNGCYLLADIGTNSEILLSVKGKILCASTAAGPALEGGNISCGMGCAEGAVYSVNYDSKKSEFNYKTIGDAPPAGICGSGAIDLAAELISHGFIDETGRLTDMYYRDGVRLADNVTFTQADLRQMQLAKSALRSGIDCLIKAAGITYSSIDRVYMAGGFAENANLESYTAIGLLPAALAKKTLPTGNAALGGAVTWLCDKNAPAAAKEIIKNASLLRLSDNPAFSECFLENMTFRASADERRGFSQKQDGIDG